MDVLLFVSLFLYLPPGAYPSPLPGRAGRRPLVDPYSCPRARPLTAPAIITAAWVPGARLQRAGGHCGGLQRAEDEGPWCVP